MSESLETDLQVCARAAADGRVVIEPMDGGAWQITVRSSAGATWGGYGPHSIAQAAAACRQAIENVP